MPRPSLKGQGIVYIISYKHTVDSSIMAVPEFLKGFLKYCHFCLCLLYLFWVNIGERCFNTQYMTNSTLVSPVKMEYGWKEYFPNLLEITLLPRFFVYWARYFKFWLLAYFFILLNCAKFEEDWTTFILDILQGSPLWIFGKLQKQKTSKGGPL